MGISEEILDAIKIAINKAIAQTQVSDISTVVTATDKNKYEVIIDGEKYKVSDGINLSPTVGTPVWVHIPNGDITKAYIAAKR